MTYDQTYEETFGSDPFSVWKLFKMILGLSNRRDVSARVDFDQPFSAKEMTINVVDKNNAGLQSDAFIFDHIR